MSLDFEFIVNVNFESIFEKSVNFESIFEVFLSMVDELSELTNKLGLFLQKLMLEF